MGKITNQHDQLADLEKRFRQRLIVALERAAAGESTGIFASPRLRRPNAPAVPEEVAYLEQVGAQTRKLRARLDESEDTGIFAQYLAYCARWADEKDPKRPNEQTLAKEFLKVLKA